MMTTVLLLAGWLGIPAPSAVEIRRADVPGMEIRAEAVTDAPEIKLSGEIRLRLSVEGPATLDVVRPKPLLASTGLWRVREDGLPLREVLPNRRQRWTQEYQLSPLVPGDAIPISLSPLVVRAGTSPEVRIEWSKTLPIKITTAIRQPSVDDLRPVTAIEETPAEPPPPDSTARWWWLAFSGLLAVLIVALDQRRRRFRDVPEAHDAAWAERQLAETADPDRLVVILRQFLEHRLNRPFASRTSAELVEELRQIPVGEIQLIETFLTTCDTARFSGTPGDLKSLRELLREIVRRLSAVESGEGLNATRSC